MKRERRKPTRAEWAAITSKRPVVRRIARPEQKKADKAQATEREGDGYCIR